MPRFYFDMTEGMSLEPDVDGLEFSNVEAAETAAMQVAGEMSLERLPITKGGSVTVEVRNDQGQVVITVKVSMGSERAIIGTIH